MLKADLRNLSSKLKDGKPLAAGERAALQSIAQGGEASAVAFAHNQVDLARLLGVTRKTIQRHLKREGNPGARADGRYDVLAWREYLKAFGSAGEDEADKIDAGRERARNILLKNERLEFDLAVARREYVSAEEVEKAVAAMIGTARRRLLSGPPTLAPQVVGVTIPEAEKLLQEWIHSVLSLLHKDPLGLEKADNEPGDTSNV